MPTDSGGSADMTVPPPGTDAAAGACIGTPCSNSYACCPVDGGGPAHGIACGAGGTCEACNANGLNDPCLGPDCCPGLACVNLRCLPYVDAGPSRSCVGDAGSGFSAWIQDAGIGHLCDTLLCNVEVKNTGTGPIGPITVTTVYVPAVGASWSAVAGSPYPAIAPGTTAAITVGNPDPTHCPALSCPGAVDIEIEISGPGIPPGSRACGLAQVGGC
jgi:hypothetical protein